MQTADGDRGADHQKHHNHKTSCMKDWTVHANERLCTRNWNLKSMLEHAVNLFCTDNAALLKKVA